MTSRIVAGTSLAAALFMGVAFAADGLESGPQLGKNARPAPFNPLHCNGPDNGKKVCLV